MFSQLTEKVAFINYLPLLTQATVDDGEPTPGYLLGEIKNISFQSLSCSQQLAEYLIHRLTKSVTPVKIKVLKIIIYLIHNGHVSFRQTLRKSDGPIKITVMHSGPLDPLLGNTLYKEVQKLAQEALDLLFNPDMIEQEEKCAQTLASLESPTIYFGGMGSAAKSSGKYEGFGNSPREKDGTVTDKMLDYFGRLINQSEEQTSEAIRAALHSSPGDYQPVPVAGPSIDPLISAEPPVSKLSFSKCHVPGKAGGGWESDEDDNTEEFVNSIENIHSCKSPVTTRKVSNASRDSFQRMEQPVTGMSFNETQRIVMSYSMKPALPSLDELDEVCLRCATSDQGEVIRALVEVMIGPRDCDNEGILIRAMLLLEWLLHFDKFPEQSLFVHGVPKILENLATDEKMTNMVQSKAKKLRLSLHSRSKVLSRKSEDQSTGSGMDEKLTVGDVILEVQQ